MDDPFSHLDKRVIVLETQYKRIVSDLESEKRTRAGVHSSFNLQITGIHTHLKEADRFQNRILGALIVVNGLIVPVVVAILVKLLWSPS